MPLKSKYSCCNCLSLGGCVWQPKVTQCTSWGAPVVPIRPCKHGGLLDSSGAVVHDGRLETGCAVSESGIITIIIVIIIVIIIITNSISINGANKSTPGKRQGREAKDKTIFLLLHCFHLGCYQAPLPTAGMDLSASAKVVGIVLQVKLPSNL